MKKLRIALVSLVFIFLCSNTVKAQVNFQVDFDQNLNAQFASSDSSAYTDGTFPSQVTGYNGQGQAVQNTYGTTLKYKTSNLNQRADSIKFKFQLPFGLNGDNGQGRIAGGYSFLEVSSSSHYIYVLDTVADQIIRASMDGSGWDRLGSHGSGDGKFNFYGFSDISVDPNTETLYITDYANSRIIKTKFDGSNWTEYLLDGRTAVSIYYDPVSDYIYYYDDTNNEIVKEKFGGTSTTALSLTGISNTVYDLAYDPIGDFVYFCNALDNFVARVKMDGSGLLTLGSEGSGVNQFDLPYSIDYADGYLYICDENNHRVVKTQIDGTGWTTVGTSGIGEGKINDSTSISYDASTGYIYMLDYPARYGGNNSLHRTKIDGTSWSSYGVPGTGTIQEANRLVYDHASGNFYIAAAYSQIIRTKKDGTGWKTIGEWSGDNGPYDFLYITGLDFDSTTGNLYALDHYYDSVSKFDMEESVWQKLTTNGSTDFSVPRGLSYDSESEYIYVGDMDHQRIVRSKIDGTGWTSYGSIGSGIGQFSYPYNVYHDKTNGYTYVSDFNNKRVVRFKMDIGNDSWQALDTSSYYTYGGPSFVVDEGTDSVFIPKGSSQIQKVNMNGTDEGSFSVIGGNWPAGVDAVSPLYYDNADDTLFISDVYNIYHCTSSGEYIETITANPEKVLLKTSGEKPFEITISAYNGKFGLSLNKYELPISLSTGKTMSEGSWHELEVNFNKNSGIAELFIDGESIINQENLSTAEVTKMSDMGDYIYIASDPDDPNRTFPGAIDDLTFGVPESSTPTVSATSTSTSIPSGMTILPETGSNLSKPIQYPYL